MMPAYEATRVLDVLASTRLPAWVDGGWGIDALLGSQSRLHEDLDLVLALADADAAILALEQIGYRLSVDERPTRFVLEDADDCRVDFHTVTFDAAGNGWQELPGGARFAYTSTGLDATGAIEGRIVRCLSPELQIACHLGYEPDENDCADMRRIALCFGIELPSQYV